MTDSLNERYTVFADQGRNPLERAIQVRPYENDGRVQIKITSDILPSNVIDPPRGFGIVLDKDTAIKVAHQILNDAEGALQPFDSGQLVLDVNSGEVFQAGVQYYYPDGGWFVALTDRDGNFRAVRPAKDFETTDRWPIAVGDFVRSRLGGTIYRIVEITPNGYVGEKENGKRVPGLSADVADWYEPVKVAADVQLVAKTVWTVVE